MAELKGNQTEEATREFRPEAGLPKKNEEKGETVVQNALRDVYACYGGSVRAPRPEGRGKQRATNVSGPLRVHNQP